MPAEVQALRLEPDPAEPDRGGGRQDRAHPGALGVEPGQEQAGQPRGRAQAAYLRPRQGDRAAVDGDQAVARRPWQRRQADRVLPVRGPDRRRQDRYRQATRQRARHRVRALRHERVHGEAHGVAADRRAARLRRLRSGRPAHRRDQQAPVLRRAARRDREGAPRHLQHPAAGDGSRHADRQQRPQERLPQRHPDHEQQRGQPRDGSRVDRVLRRLRGPGRRQGRQEGARTRVHAGVPQPARRHGDVPGAPRRGHPHGRAQVPRRARRSARREARRPRRHRRRARLVRRARLRQGDGRAADGAPRPVDAEGAARERDPVRQAHPRRHRPRRCGQGRDRDPLRRRAPHRCRATTSSATV